MSVSVGYKERYLDRVFGIGLDGTCLRCLLRTQRTAMIIHQHVLTVSDKNELQPALERIYEPGVLLMTGQCYYLPLPLFNDQVKADICPIVQRLLRFRSGPRDVISPWHQHHGVSKT